MRVGGSYLTFELGSSLAQSLTDAVAKNKLNGVAFEVEVFSR